MAEHLRRGVTRRKIAVAVATVIIVAVGGFAFLLGTGTRLCLQSTTTTNSSAQSGGNYTVTEEVGKAASYLAKNYDRTVGLVPETPDSCVFWLYSDNFLAATALLQYGHAHGNATLATIAANILTSLSKYQRQLDGAGNQYALLISSPCEVNSSHDYTVSVSHGVQIKATLNNGTGELSDHHYADVAFLKAICFAQPGGNLTQASQEYALGRNLFDGTGFKDLPYNETGQYQTYKLALFIYASAVLKQPVNGTALSTLLSMQAQDGGFYTGYDVDHSHAGTLTNTETTSLAILALSNYLQS